MELWPQVKRFAKMLANNTTKLYQTSNETQATAEGCFNSIMVDNESLLQQTSENSSTTLERQTCRHFLLIFFSMCYFIYFQARFRI